MHLKLHFLIHMMLVAIACANLAWAETVYHGSPARFEKPLPRPNRRDFEGKLIWKGDGVFAAYDRRIAVVYTNSHHLSSAPRQGYSQSINLYKKITPDEPLEVTVYGGADLDEALDALYGKATSDNLSGYVYCMDDRSFKREEGLGDMEVVSRVSPDLIDSSECPHGVQTFNRRTELEKYVKSGRIRLKWRRF